MFRKMRLDKQELKDLLKGWLLVAIIFAIGTAGFSMSIVKAFFISIITVGFGFLLHELAHKFMAQKEGYSARFKLSNFPVMIGSLIAAIFGIIIIAPGMVVIANSWPDAKKEGKIAFAGPTMNAMLAVIFLVLSFITGGILGEMCVFGVFVNAWIGAFNCIPLWVLDGKKIFSWNKKAYFSLIGVLIVLFLISRII